MKRSLVEGLTFYSYRVLVMEEGFTSHPVTFSLLCQSLCHCRNKSFISVCYIMGQNTKKRGFMLFHNEWRLNEVKQIYLKFAVGLQIPFSVSITIALLYCSLSLSLSLSLIYIYIYIYICVCVCVCVFVRVCVPCLSIFVSVLNLFICLTLIIYI